MYAIVRRYTPEVVEGGKNECLGELTGLRTFFKMTYQELAKAIRKDLEKEIGVTCSVRVATEKEFDGYLKKSKPTKTISTFNEMNTLFTGASFVDSSVRRPLRASLSSKKMRLTVPYLGKVA